MSKIEYLKKSMPKLSPEEIALFRASVKGVKPLKTDKVQLKQKSTIKRRIRRDSAQLEEFPFSDFLRDTVETDTKLSFARAGIQEKVLRSLRQGKMRQTEILDLHGATVAEARVALSQFLTDCLEHGARCVGIIHGKGKLELTPPLLKNHVNNWLRQHPAVLAFSSAQPRDGGTGAVYVLLRRQS